MGGIDTTALAELLVDLVSRLKISSVDLVAVAS